MGLTSSRTPSAYPHRSTARRPGDADRTQCGAAVLRAGARHGPVTATTIIVVVVLVVGAVLGGCSLLSTPSSPLDPTEVSPVRFDPASFWYDPIPATATVDPKSEVYVAEMARRYGDRLVLVAREGSVTVFAGDTATLRRSVPLTGGTWHGDKRVAGLTNVPLPDYVVPDPADDGHMAIVDAEVGVELDLWQARMMAGRWVATVAAVIALESDGVHRSDTVRASGFALTAGLIWPDELVEGGSIDHAVVLGYAHTRRDAFVSPASWSDGWSEEEFALPMGAHLRLDPNLNLDLLDLSAFERIIAEAMQTYGMYIHDTNSVDSILELEAVNPLSFSEDPYLALPGFAEAGYGEHGAVTLSPELVPHFQVLELPPVQDADSVDQTVEPSVSGYFYYREEAGG